MEDDFKNLVEDVKSDVDKILAKFDELEQLGSNSQLAVVKTHLEAASARMEQELAKHTATAAQLTPEPPMQDPATNGQTGVPDAPGPAQDPATQPEPTGTDTSRNGEVSDQTPSGPSPVPSQNETATS